MVATLSPIEPDIGNLGEAFQRVITFVNALSAAIDGGGGAGGLIGLGDTVLPGETNVAVMSHLATSGDDVLSIQPPDGGTGVSAIEINSFGGNPAAVYYLSAGGAKGAPSPVQDDGLIGYSNYRGYAETGYRDSASYYIRAAQTFDDTHFAAYWEWGTQALDQSFSVRLRISGSGAIHAGEPTGTDASGDFNAAGSFRVNGVPLHGSGAATAVAGAATLNKQNGAITSEALTGATTYTLTLTNSVILSTSTVLVNLANSATLLVTLKSKTVSAGQVVIVMSMAALTGTVLIDFAVFN